MNNNTDILNELKEISPILLHLKENEQLLIIPIGYFEQLADNCMAEIIILIRLAIQFLLK